MELCYLQKSCMQSWEECPQIPLDVHLVTKTNPPSSWSGYGPVRNLCIYMTMYIHDCVHRLLLDLPGVIHLIICT